MGQTPGGQIEWRSRDETRVETFSTSPALSPFARQIEAFSSFRNAGRPWPFSPQRDLAHFTVLLDAMNRAEAKLVSARTGNDESLASTATSSKTSSPVTRAH